MLPRAAQAAVVWASRSPPTFRTDPAPDFPRKPHPRLLNSKTCPTSGRWDGEHRGWVGGIWHAAEHKSPPAPETGRVLGHFEAKVVPWRLLAAAQQRCSRHRCSRFCSIFKETNGAANAPHIYILPLD